MGKRARSVLTRAEQSPRATAVKSGRVCCLLWIGGVLVSVFCSVLVSMDCEQNDTQLITTAEEQTLTSSYSCYDVRLRSLLNLTDRCSSVVSGSKERLMLGHAMKGSLEDSPVMLSRTRLKLHGTAIIRLLTDPHVKSLTLWPLTLW